MHMTGSRSTRILSPLPCLAPALLAHNASAKMTMPLLPHFVAAELRTQLRAPGTGAGCAQTPMVRGRD
eukprot:349719-Chlamydomonas_euryale.AAC.3